MEGRAAPPPAAALLGWELIAVDPEAGTIEVAFTASEQFLNPVGAIQGGFLAAMLDDTLGPALVATLGPGLFAPTTDLHVQFLRPARPGRLTGRGRIVRRGRAVAFLAGELLDDSGQVVATAVATAQVRGVLPAAAVHNLTEQPPVGPADRRQRPVGGVAERDEQSPAERVVVCRSDHHDRGRRAGHVAGAPPDPGQLAELPTVGDDDEIPRLPVLRGRGPAARLQDLVQVRR